MAPDADKLRQRNNNNNNDNVSSIVKDDPLLEEVEKTINNLKSNEIVIDGIIYDISSFNHPGGDSINIFGGNDVTTVYRMIHPHHIDNKHLDKLHRVGSISKETYKNCEYKFNTEFEQEIKREVFKIVKRGAEYGTYGYFFRAICYITFYFYLHYLWVYAGQVSYTLAIVYGISQALIGLNVQHDANHGATSKKVFINNLFGLGADFIGGSKWLWMEKHWWHHAYTNHKDMDPDGLAAEPALLFNDYELGNSKRTFLHAYQVLWFFIVLSGYWASAVFNLPAVWYVKDAGVESVGMNLNNNPWIASRKKYAFTLRMYYLLSNVGGPIYHCGLNWNTFGLINVMGISGSLALGMLFTLSHNFVNAERDPTKSVRETGEPVCWFKAQVETSSTYGGMISGWLTGGLNFQVEHHLFPRMSSAWYPYIAPTVRRICKKHNVRYIYYPWVWQNMISTLKYTHAVGNGSNWKNQLNHGNPYKGEL